MSAQACTKGPNAEGAWKTAGRARQMLRITGAKAPWKGEPSNLQLLLMVDGGGSKRSVSARVLKTRLAALVTSCAALAMEVGYQCSTGGFPSKSSGWCEDGVAGSCVTVNGSRLLGCWSSEEG